MTYHIRAMICMKQFLRSNQMRFEINIVIVISYVIFFVSDLRCIFFCQVPEDLINMLGTVLFHVLTL